MPSRFMSLMGLVVLLAAGCDGGGLSKQEYIEQADRICKDASDEVEEIGQPKSEEELQEFGDEVIAINERAIEEIGDLEPPEGDAETLESFVSQLEESLEQQRNLLDALEQGDQERITSITTELTEASNDIRKLASDYGFKECNRIGLE